jgi:hypothetical protein
MRRVVKLQVVRSEKARAEAKELRREFYQSVGDIMADAGDNVSGYAIVMWNKDGENWSVVKPGKPFLSRMVPTFAGDSLTQHVTKVMSDK